jgi:hypothetical protein
MTLTAGISIGSPLIPGKMDAGLNSQFNEM